MKRDHTAPEIVSLALSFMITRKSDKEKRTRGNRERSLFSSHAGVVNGYHWFSCPSPSHIHVLLVKLVRM